MIKNQRKWKWPGEKIGEGLLVQLQRIIGAIALIILVILIIILLIGAIANALQMFKDRDCTILKASVGDDH